MTVAQLLKRPDLQEQDVLSVLRKVSDDLADLDLEGLLAIIKYVVPHYMVWSDEINSLLNGIFLQSLKNISQLISFGASMDPKVSERRIYCGYTKSLILQKVGYLKNYITESGETNVIEQLLRRLFVGSTIYNFLSGDIDVITYINKICAELALVIQAPLSEDDLSVVGKFIGSFINFHGVFVPSELFSSVLLKDQISFDSFVQIMSKSSLLTRRRVISGAMLKYLESKCTPETFLSILVILRRTEIYNLIDNDELYKLKLIYLQELVISTLLIPKVTSLINYLLAKFSKIDGQTDEKTCTLLTLVLKKYSTDEQKEYICHSDIFLTAVTKRLSEKDRLVRERTMYIAKLTSKDQIQYESDFVIETDSFISTTTTSDDTIDWDSLNSDIRYQHLINTQKSDQVVNLEKLSLDDSDDEEEDDDDDVNTIGNGEYVFIKDLAAAFAKNNVTQKVKLFKNVIKLVRRKRDFQTEVNYFAPSLISGVAIMNNDADEKQFEEYRVNALVSIIVVVPDNINKLYDILFNSELSLQQRMSILASVSMSSRELRGYNDEHILKPEFDFPSERLPWDLSDQTSHLQIKDISQNDQSSSLIGPGKPVWKSKKLLQGNEKPTNRFRDYASKFFYPLANGWLNGIDMGTFDKLFKMYYLNTLKIVYDCSNPVNDYETMTVTLQQIIEDATAQDIPLEIK
ncbi:Telomere length regulation protein TEL2 [Nakaseomyces bracarensis]|uniref:Telomere length regulation protein TEL2 n=1 Tax=Nakaseomyces bracarensis TaxID=273131 RepID=A0ABR4NR85_9SACH